jgi:hypothetical protein
MMVMVLLMNIKVTFLSVITLEFTLFFGKMIFEYYVNNLSLHKDDKRIEFTSTAGADFIGLIILIC